MTALAKWVDVVPAALVLDLVVVGTPHHRTADTIRVAPISPTGAVVGVDYTFDMSHCGILSPIDVDGSFWDPVGVLADPVAFDGSRGTFRLLDPQTATFTGSTGLVLRLTRHQDAKTFGFCF